MLLEMHGERDLDYADLAPDLYGINNRNLGSFVTDVENSFHMASRLPKEGCKVSESGLSNPETVNSLRLELLAIRQKLHSDELVTTGIRQSQNSCKAQGWLPHSVSHQQ